MNRAAINWVGLVLVGAAAAILTFNTLRSLAESCGFTGWMGWLLPISVDAAGAVATNVWLTGKDSPNAVRFARTWALTAAGVSLVGNGTQHGLAAYGMAVPWWAVVLVAVIPPLALVGTVHLMVLLSQGQSRVEMHHERDEQDALLERARAVLADNPSAGRSVLARELDVTTHQARQLKAALASTNGHQR